MGGFPLSSINKHRTRTMTLYLLERCLESSLWVFSLWLYLSCHLKGDSLSLHVGCPACPSGSEPNYAARQAGMREPMLLEGGINAGLIRACNAQWQCQCALWGTGEGWLHVTNHTSSPDQSSGNVNLLSHVAAGSTWGCFAVPAALSIGTISKWPHWSYQYLTADFSEKASQLGVLSSHPSFSMDGLNWHYSGEFGGTALISPAERFYCITHAAIAYSYEICRHLSRHPCFFHVFIRRTFS